MEKIKKILLANLVIITIICFSQSNVYAQGISIGLKGGLNLNSQAYSSIDNLSFDTKNILGYNAGAYVKISIATFVIQPELLYSSEGTNITVSAQGSLAGTSTNRDETYGYFRMPILVGVKITKLSLLVGPNLGFLLNSSLSKVNNTTTLTNVTFKNIIEEKSDFDFGLTFGIDFQIIKKLGAGVRYNLGLTNIQKASNTTVPEVKNRSFQFMVSYTLFNLGV